MILNPRDVRQALKEALAGPLEPSTRRAIRDAVNLITTMTADLRRQGLTEYDDKEESTETQ